MQLLQLVLTSTCWNFSFYTLPGTWTKCNALIPHYNADPNTTLGISIIVILIMLSGLGIYKAFFNNKNLTDPWDDHDD